MISDNLTWKNDLGWWFYGLTDPIGPYSTQEVAEEKYMMYYQFLSAPECHHI